MRDLPKLLLLVGVILGLITVWGLTRADESPPAAGSLEREEKPVVPVPGTPELKLGEPRTVAVPGPPSPDGARVAATSEVNGSPGRELLGRLVDAAGGEPLPGYGIAILPSGQKPRRGVPAFQTTVTDDDGGFQLVDLPVRGPWDVYALPYDPLRPRRRLTVRRRVGSVPALPPGEGAVQTFQATVGPTVVLRGPRPPGVAPSDLIFEALGEINPFSSQTGLNGGRAVGRGTEQGWSVGRIPPIQNSLVDDGYGVRVVSRDGRWAIAERRDGRLTNTTEAVIDGALSPRGVVRFEVEIEGVAPGAASETDLITAARWVGFTLPLGDPDRESVDLPRELMASEFSRAAVHRGGNVFEFQDLPVGPVEFKTHGRGYSNDAVRYELRGQVHAPAEHREGVPARVLLRRIP